MERAKRREGEEGTREKDEDIQCSNTISTS